jgi:hypothetical protein
MHRRISRKRLDPQHAAVRIDRCCDVHIGVRVNATEYSRYHRHGCPLSRFRQKGAHATDARASGTTYVSDKITFTDLATFTGIVSGTSVTYVDGYHASWVGLWQGKLVGGESFYRAVAHGTGDLAGMKMMFTHDSTRTPAIEGRLLDPHGG